MRFEHVTSTMSVILNNQHVTSHHFKVKILEKQHLKEQYVMS